MTGIEAFILGLIEGITEFLPISSTGHLIIASELLRIPNSEFLKTFEISIQLGAIGAVVVTYWRKLFVVDTILKLAAGFLPTAVVGLVFYQIIKTYLIGNTALVITMLALGGAAIIIFEMFHTEPQADAGITTISYRQAAIIGLFQSVAMIPGVSRSAAAIIGGLSLGLTRATIVEFAFLLAIPTMLAATSLDLLKNYSLFSSSDVSALIIGFVTAFIVGLIAIRFLLGYIRRFSFIPFGIYRIVAALVFFLLIY